MFNEKKYVGVALQSYAFSVAQVEATARGIKLLKLDSSNLAENTGGANDMAFNEAADPTSFRMKEEVSEEKVFGFDENNASKKREEAEVDFSQLEAEAENSEVFSLGRVDEENSSATNYVLLYNILNNISRKSIDCAINIPAGNTIFQILKDRFYNNVKDKEIIESVEDKLQAIYGEQKSADYYAYEIRENGSLVLASIDEPSAMLNIIDETTEFYRGTLNIKEIYADEVALIGLFRHNYDPDPNAVSALIQFGRKNCRILFLKGHEIFLITPLINEGMDSGNFLNVIFSKILFQLDSDLIPELNRIVIANNSIGDRAVEFLQDRFPNSEVENFDYNESFLDRGKFDESTLNPFTTAIALGAAAVAKDELFPNLSMLPEYVVERQKIFKLEWHGILLLLLIFLTFPAANYFYQQNAHEIKSFSAKIERTNTQIEQIQPVVDQVNTLSQNLSLLTSKLGVLDSLSTGSKAWSARLDILDKEMPGISNSWFTSLSKTQNGTLLEGYTLYRNRIPAVVDIFDKATLLNVNTETIREKELYKFSLVVQEFSTDSSIYSPEKPARIEKILNN